MDATIEYVKRTVSLMVWYVGLQGAWFFYDLFFHANLMHPFWNEQYNWIPIAWAVVVGTVLVSALWMAAERFVPTLIARFRRQPVRQIVALQLAELNVASTTVLARLSQTSPKRPQLIQ